MDCLIGRVSAELGNYSADVPLLLNQESSCPYRYVSIEGTLHPPTLTFSPPGIVCGPLPLNVEVSNDIIIRPVDYSHCWYFVCFSLYSVAKLAFKQTLFKVLAVFFSYYCGAMLIGRITRLACSFDYLSVFG